MASVQSDEQILNSIFNPELPFEQLTSAEKLAKVAKDYSIAQENTFDHEKLAKYKSLQNDAIECKFTLYWLKISKSYSDK